MTPEPLKDKKITYYCQELGDSLKHYGGVYNHKNIKSAVEYLRGIMCECDKLPNKCWHCRCIDKAFPDLYE